MPAARPGRDFAKLVAVGLILFLRIPIVIHPA